MHEIDEKSAIVIDLQHPYLINQINILLFRNNDYYFYIQVNYTLINNYYLFHITNLQYIQLIINLFH